MCGSGSNIDCCERADICAMAAGGPSDSRALCMHMSAVYAEKTDMCDQLEAIADSLPYRVDRSQCLRLARRLGPLLREAHAFEEELLFPHFEASRQNVDLQGTVARLKSEHRHDECAAQEISEELLMIGHGKPIRNPEALGFMLRAFFETVRRHLAAEREMIFPDGIVPTLSTARKD